MWLSVKLKFALSSWFIVLVCYRRIKCYDNVTMHLFILGITLGFNFQICFFPCWVLFIMDILTNLCLEHLLGHRSSTTFFSQALLHFLIFFLNCFQVYPIWVVSASSSFCQVFFWLSTFPLSYSHSNTGLSWAINKLGKFPLFFQVVMSLQVWLSMTLCNMYCHQYQHGV